MAKDRHRIFEIYESRDEAAWELMPKANKAGNDVAATEKSSFQQLVVLQLGGITQVRFKEAEISAPEIVSQIQDELLQLADELGGDSRVLIDFTGEREFGSAAISALMAFNKKLHVRGSRMVLCCLDANVRKSFFPIQ